jgi:hypothetical protein
VQRERERRKKLLLQLIAMTSSEEPIPFDGTFLSPFSYIVSGASQSGKTTHVFNFLKARHTMMDSPTDRIYFFYNQWQPSFTEFAKLGIVTEWINKLPTTELLKEKSFDPDNVHNGCIVIIDDYMSSINNDIADLFTVLSHAHKINTILLTQNIFAKNPVFRTISLNATYISIFKNPRDASQIVSYARQFAPGDTQYIVQAYRTCTVGAYSYIFFDHHQAQRDDMRVRSGILPHEQMRVWTSAAGWQNA